MPPLPAQYHFALTIGGKEYGFVLPEGDDYSFADVSDFTRRRASSGTLDRLDEVASFEQRSFHGGMGQLEMIEESAYRHSDNVNPAEPGMVTLLSKAESETDIGASSPQFSSPTTQSDLPVSLTSGYLFSTGTTRKRRLMTR